MADQVRRVVRQTQARVFAGLTQFPDKLVSLFEPHTEVIRKGKAGQPNEFGKLVQLQEAENQIITHYEVYEERPRDRHLLLPAVKAHRRKLGRVPGWVAADAGFYSQANEEGAQAQRAKYVSIPNRSTRSVERRRWEKQRWFKKGQKWRTDARDGSASSNDVMDCRAPLSRTARHETVGRTGRDRRQLDQHGATSGAAAGVNHARRSLRRDCGGNSPNPAKKPPPALI